jgi:hypothetical protein
MILLICFLSSPKYLKKKTSLLLGVPFDDPSFKTLEQYLERIKEKEYFVNILVITLIRFYALRTYCCHCVRPSELMYPKPLVRNRCFGNQVFLEICGLKSLKVTFDRSRSQEMHIRQRSLDVKVIQSIPYMQSKLSMINWHVIHKVVDWLRCSSVSIYQFYWYSCLNSLCLLWYILTTLENLGNGTVKKRTSKVMCGMQMCHFIVSQFI